MTDKEKIAQIIAEHLCLQGKSHKRLYGSERMCYSRDNFAECEKVSKCVDALIAAGFGNVADWKHRTDVAERALLFLCDKTMSDVSVMIFPSTKTQVRNNQELYDYCIKQAEKELAEEEDDRKRKND